MRQYAQLGLKNLFNELGGKMTAATEKNIKETITDFIFSSITIDDLDDDDNLFETGIINSLFAIQLMTFIEKSFGVEVTMDDLDIENFKSINATTSFVMKKNDYTAQQHL